ncbi:MAG: hypothetical protein O7H41_16620 [Planctomycetota bacterium]|nr:hypothetical protein [Planctomycetota bacterium]
MRDVPDKERRGAALVMALGAILAIVMMLVGFLHQSLTYSNLAAQDRVKAQVLEMAEMGLAMTYTRLKNGFPLDNIVEDEREEPAGRFWDKGEVDGTAKDGAHEKTYHVDVWYSNLEPIKGAADSGSNDTTLVDSELRETERPGTWFKGKKFMMISGELAGLDLVIEEFDGASGTITFEKQDFSIAVGDNYEVPGGIEYQFKAKGDHDAGFNMGDKTAKTERHIETWWWRQSKPLKKYSQRGAVVANGLVELRGNIEIDGRDHCANGGEGMEDFSCPEGIDHHILGDGVKGISTTGSVDQGGSSKIGGDGDAPAGKADDPPGTDYTETYPDPADIDNGTDDDGDGKTDEDPYNGVDDDRLADGTIEPDGKRDEDLRFPLNPDEALGLEKGSLEAIARESGTFFTDFGAFKTHYNNNGKQLEGGKVYYLNIEDVNMGGFAGGIKMDFSGSDDPSEDPEELKPVVFIVHYEDALGNPIANVGPLHIKIKGLLMIDGVSRINAGCRIVGGVQTLRSDTKANTFGNGQAKIWFSTAALANLPDDLSASSWNASSWKEDYPEKQ